jgi:hypothetical protein
MDPARPLRSVFADLAGGRDFGASAGLAPEEVLAAHGHPDLPEGLVAEAVVNYADTAPVEVAEHLAPYVRAHTAVPQPGGTGEPEAHWFDLLTTAPAPGLGGPDVIDAEASGLAVADAPAAGPDTPGTPADADIDDDFGSGHRGPVEDVAGPALVDDAAGPAPVGDAPLTWSATTEPTVDPADLDMGMGIDLRPTDEATAPGDDAGPVSDEEPDAIDGA